MTSMTDRIHVVQVGAPDPELRNSPIVEETDEDYEIAARTLPDDLLCYFNGNAIKTTNSCAAALN